MTLYYTVWFVDNLAQHYFLQTFWLVTIQGGMTRGSPFETLIGLLFWVLSD